MPCYTPPHSCCEHKDNERENILCDVLESVKNLDKENTKIFENLKDEIKYYRKQSDKTTEMLCRILNSLEFETSRIEIDNDIKEWKIKHDEFDTKRKENK
jgi:hypothetical protein